MKLNLTPLQKALLAALTAATTMVPREAAAQTPNPHEQGAWYNGVYYPGGYGVITAERKTRGSRGMQPPGVYGIGVPLPGTGTQVSIGVGVGWSRVTRNGVISGGVGIQVNRNQITAGGRMHVLKQEPSLD